MSSAKQAKYGILFLMIPMMVVLAVARSCFGDVPSYRYENRQNEPTGSYESYGPFPTEMSSPPNQSGLIKGNINYESGKRYYHVPGMRDYDITIIDTSQGERWFRTEQEAQAAGWQRAPDGPRR